jgi:hypothetical protein
MDLSRGSLGEGHKGQPDPPEVARASRPLWARASCPRRVGGSVSFISCCRSERLPPRFDFAQASTSAQPALSLSKGRGRHARATKFVATREASRRLSARPGTLSKAASYRGKSQKPTKIPAVAAISTRRPFPGSLVREPARRCRASGVGPSRRAPGTPWAGRVFPVPCGPLSQFL